jgi:spermidine synthase
MALWFHEVFEDRFSLGLKVERTLHTEQTPYQHLAIFETEKMGKVLTLDHIFMTSEADEFTYHEMIVHPALCALPKPRRVLVIGGGDGGTAREVLSHPEVETCVMVEIDEAVVRACQEHLPEIGGSVWEDPRLDLRFEDGIEFVKSADVEPFDAILLDGSDPVGPAEGLFNESFYRGVERVLADDGVFALQSETPTIMPNVFFPLQFTLREVFADVRPLFGSVVLYGGGMWTWTHASKQARDPFAFDEARMARQEARCRYYNRDIHRAAFAVPTFVRRRLEEGA